MKKQNLIRITLLVIALGLTANGCGHAEQPAFHEETIPTASVPEMAAETVAETVAKPTLSVDRTTIEIGYNTPLNLQGDVTIIHPVLSAAEPGQAVSETSETLTPPEQELPSHELVTIHLSTSDVLSCSYELKNLEWTPGWEDEYHDTVLTENTAYTSGQENIQAGYRIQDGQILFERLGVYEITVLAEGMDGTSLTETITVTVIDNIPPVLHVPEEISFTAGEDWTTFLAECTAEDEIDGNLYGSIVFQDEKNNPFHPEAPGEYLLRFSVKDYAGNEAAVVSHVIVTEKKAVSKTSGNNTNDNDNNRPSDSPAESGSHIESAVPENNTSSEAIPDNPEPVAPQPQPPETQAPVETEVPAEPQPAETVPEAPAPETEPPAETCEYLDGGAVVDLINHARAEAGLGTVSWEGSLLELAQTRASEQSIKIGHERPDGSHILQYYGMGECTAWGYSSVEAAFNAWMASEGHQAAILWETHTRCCLAGYKDSTGIYWVLILE